MPKSDFESVLNTSDAYSYCTSDSLSSSSESENENNFDEDAFIEDDKIDYLIYENASLKKSQFNILLTLFITRHSLNQKCSKDLLKLICFLLPQPNKISKSVEKLYINHDVTKPVKKFVCSGCWKTKTNIDSHCENADCIFNQRTTVKESGLEVLYLDASQQLASILKREKLTILKYKNV